MHERHFDWSKVTPKSRYTYTNDVYRSLEPSRDPRGAMIRPREKARDVVADRPAPQFCGGVAVSQRLTGSSFFSP